MYTKNDLILALHDALLTNIRSNFRLICIDWNGDEWLKIRIYSDKEVTDEDTEILACILTDLAQDIRFKHFYKEVMHSKQPLHELERLKCVLYARQEGSVF